MRTRSSRTTRTAGVAKSDRLGTQQRHGDRRWRAPLNLTRGFRCSSSWRLLCGLGAVLHPTGLEAARSMTIRTIAGLCGGRRSRRPSDRDGTTDAVRQRASSGHGRPSDGGGCPRSWVGSRRPQPNTTPASRSPPARSLVMSAARETVRGSSYLTAGRSDAYNPDLIYYVTDEQFGYTAYVVGPDRAGQARGLLLHGLRSSPRA